MSDFISEDDLLTFEGWLRYQAVPATTPPEEQKLWREMYDEMTRLRDATPKVGLMKRQHVPSEQKYAVAIRKGAGLWLTMWVRCSPKGELFVLYPGGKARGDAHASYHVTGRYHHKSHGGAFMREDRQPLTAAFSGSEHMGQFGGHGTRTGAICDPMAFDGLVIIRADILGPRDGSVGVDLVEPAHGAEVDPEQGARALFRGRLQAADIRLPGPTKCGDHEHKMVGASRSGKGWRLKNAAGLSPPGFRHSGGAVRAQDRS